MTPTVSSTADTAKTKADGPAVPKTSKVSGDFETFLKMLTVQMQNQDPLNPVDSADYAVQLATFSGVEQQVKTNDILQKLVDGFKSDGLNSLAGWIGREVPAATSIAFDGTPKTLMITPDEKANRTVIEVRNADGKAVQHLTVPKGANQIEWRGLKTDGSTLKNGTYSFRTLHYDDKKPISQTDTHVYQEVVEVRAGSSGGELILSGGASLPASEVKALRSKS